ncbi:retropepsin-like aspartic protease family protein [Candidatus Ulvibacter alkanivorans]|uniref:retropepsin-like aspartic protease family protein n=1 Tax=Candidatus Ulvibacter alkanivorans TaxID=2267620 RepID=UPI000DF12897|nr:retropepsin-like aspartic protease [Candidatus Ulvibacter alkanivorans]
MTQLRNFLEAKDFHRIPLKKLATGHYKLSAKINGKPGNFILDTGASTSCIGFDCISYFILKSEESEIKAAGAGAVNMETKIARKNIVSIGGWRTKNMDFILFDLSHVNEALRQAEESAVHGIIGADFLKHVRAVIDYGRNCLYVK